MNTVNVLNVVCFEYLNRFYCILVHKDGNLESDKIKIQRWAQPLSLKAQPVRFLLNAYFKFC